MILGDCLDVMPNLKHGSIGMCFADFPYAHKAKQSTQFVWDVPFSIGDWRAASSVLFCASYRMVFSANSRLFAALVSCMPDLFRHDLVWHKTMPTNYLNSRRQPLRDHEFLGIFGSKTGAYNPVMRTGRPFPASNRKVYSGYFPHGSKKSENLGTRLPRSVLSISSFSRHRIHPTQKPVALLDWLIRTYTNVGDCVLDPVSGSGTTAIAALTSNRHITCIEKNEGYFTASIERVRKHVRDNNIDAVIEERR